MLTRVAPATYKGQRRKNPPIKGCVGSWWRVSVCGKDVVKGSSRRRSVNDNEESKSRLVISDSGISEKKSEVVGLNDDVNGFRETKPRC